MIKIDYYFPTFNRSDKVPGRSWHFDINKTNHTIIVVNSLTPHDFEFFILAGERVSKNSIII